jgi:Tfp pilus assembly protein PilO
MISGGVLQKVANLAHAAGLKMDRIQPQPAINRETYRVAPFQVAISGNFRRIAQFLHVLESQPTLFSVGRFIVKCESEQVSEALKADLTFSVIVKRASFVGFAEKNDSPTQTQADDS